MAHPSTDPEFWHQRWRDGQIGFHEGVPNDALTKLWTASDGSVLVPLAGKTADLGWLAERGCDVVGVELSPLACAAWFEERGLVPERDRSGAYEVWRQGRVTLLQGDMFALEGRFDRCWDRAALVALPPELREPYAALLRRLVRRGGLLVTFDHGGSDGPPFAVSDAEVRRLFPSAVEVRRRVMEDARWPGAEEVVWRW